MAALTFWGKSGAREKIKGEKKYKCTRSEQKFAIFTLNRQMWFILTHLRIFWGANWGEGQENILGRQIPPCMPPFPWCCHCLFCYLLLILFCFSLLGLLDFPLAFVELNQVEPEPMSGDHEVEPWNSVCRSCALQIMVSIFF